MIERARATTMSPAPFFVPAEGDEPPRSPPDLAGGPRPRVSRPY